MALRSTSEGGPAASQPLGAFTFEPLVGLLPPVHFYPVLSGPLTIGETTATAYFCEATGSVFARCDATHKIQTQTGCIFIAARIIQSEELDSWAFVLPYQLVAIKREEKGKVQDLQTQLSRGIDRDNTMLDKALMLLLNGSEYAQRNVPALLECWHDTKYLYSVMEYITRDLRTVISVSGDGANCLAEGQTRNYAVQMLRALRELHAHGFCHRDISPENIMIRDGSEGGEPETAVLIDFGTAKQMRGVQLVSPEDEDDLGVTLEGHTPTLRHVGTPTSGGGHFTRPSSFGLLPGMSPPMPVSVPMVTQVSSGPGVVTRASAASSLHASIVSGGGVGVARGFDAATGGSGGMGVDSSVFPFPPTPAPIASAREGAWSSGIATDIYRAPPALGGYLPLDPPPPAGAFCKRRYADPLYMQGRPYYGVAFDLWSVAQTIYACVQGVELYNLPFHGTDRVFAAIVRHEEALGREEGCIGVRSGPGSARSSTGTATSSLLGRVDGREVSGGSTASTSTAAVHGGVGGMGGSGRVSPTFTVGFGGTGMGGGTGSSSARGASGILATPLAAHLQQVSQERIARGLPPFSASFVDLMLRTFRIRPDFRPLSVDTFLNHPWFTSPLEELSSAFMAGGAMGADAGVGGVSDSGSYFGCSSLSPVCGSSSGGDTGSTIGTGVPTFTSPAPSLHRMDTAYS